MSSVLTILMLIAQSGLLIIIVLIAAVVLIRTRVPEGIQPREMLRLCSN